MTTTNTCIAVVNAGAARLFSYEVRDDRTQKIVEEQDLPNLGRRAKDAELYSDTKTGSRKSDSPGNAGSGVHGSTDDHRDAHRDEMDAKFVKLVCDQVAQLAQARAAKHVIFAAPPRILGDLRLHFEALRKHGLQVEEILGDLSHLSQAALQDKLAEANLVAPRPRATAPQG